MDPWWVTPIWHQWTPSGIAVAVWAIVVLFAAPFPRISTLWVFLRLLLILGVTHTWQLWQAWQLAHPMWLLPPGRIWLWLYASLVAPKVVWGGLRAAYYRWGAKTGPTPEAVPLVPLAADAPDPWFRPDDPPRPRRGG